MEGVKKHSIVSAIMNNPHLRPHVVSAVAKQQELKGMCSDTHSSILRMKYEVALESFTWDRVWEELESKVPTVLKILSSDFSNTSIKPAVCVCASILLKLRNPKINLVQAMLSVVLKAGQVNIHVQCELLTVTHISFITLLYNHRCSIGCRSCKFVFRTNQLYGC